MLFIVRFFTGAPFVGIAFCKRTWLFGAMPGGKLGPKESRGGGLLGGLGTAPIKRRGGGPLGGRGP